MEQQTSDNEITIHHLLMICKNNATIENFHLKIFFRPPSYGLNQTANVGVKSPTIPNIILTGKNMTY